MKRKDGGGKETKEMVTKGKEMKGKEWKEAKPENKERYENRREWEEGEGEGIGGDGGKRALK